MIAPVRTITVGFAVSRPTTIPRNGEMPVAIALAFTNGETVCVGTLLFYVQVPAEGVRIEGGVTYVPPTALVPA